MISVDPISLIFIRILISAVLFLVSLREKLVKRHNTETIILFDDILESLFLVIIIEISIIIASVLFTQFWRLSCYILLLCLSIAIYKKLGDVLDESEDESEDEEDD
jgi:E3 ubiquitin-protein ligase DOA10